MDKRSVRKIFISVLLLVLAVAVAIPSFAWFVKIGIVAYAPVASNESLYIGAGHIQLTTDGGENNIFDPTYPFEDVRYLYLEGIDTSSNTYGTAYKDFVFCVYGEGISTYRLQLAYTTNNQFTYEIYEATEWNEEGEIPEGAVQYDAQGHQHTYYYYTARDVAISGTYLNDKTTAAGEKLGKDSSDESAYAAPQQYHIQTYGSYNNVQKYAEPIYWQTASSIAGSNNAFVHYYILRVRENGKHVNDRETDVICIAAKSSSGSS